MRSWPPVRSRRGNPTRGGRTRSSPAPLLGRRRPSSPQYATVYDGVLGPWQLDEFTAAGGIDRFDYVILLPPVDVCVERVATRLGHGFTDEAAARHMHAEFAGAAIDTRHVVTDVVDAPAAMADLLEARRAIGTFHRSP